MYRLIFILLLCPLATLSAQNDADNILATRHEVTLTVGLNQGYFRDRNYSPLNHKSSGTQFGLRYGRTTKAGHRWEYALGATLGTLTHPKDFERIGGADRYRLDVSLGYYRSASSGNPDRRTWVGASYRSYVDLSLYDGAEAVTFFALHGLEVAGITDWKTGARHRIEARAALPVFGLLSRPPYTGWDKFIVDNSENIPRIVTRGDWGFLGRFTGLRASAAWTYDLGDRWSATARYDLAYYATKRLKPFRAWDNTYSLSSTLKF